MKLYEQTFPAQKARRRRLARLAQSFADYEKRWAVSQTLAIIAGRAAMKEERE